ncbi:MAG TPA: GGDEF domain-containing protein [Bryobacteraceae bacterium]|nr:GGDEF domain-containing protein [Bryobacteraceae bacterium]
METRIYLVEDDLSFLVNQLSIFKNDIESSVTQEVAKCLELQKQPKAISTLMGDLDLLVTEIGDVRSHYRQFGGMGPISIEFAPTIKAVLLYRWRFCSTSVEARKSRTSNAEMIALLGAELEQFERLSLQDWFIEAHARQVPRLADFLNLEQIDGILRRRSRALADRVFDEKFHILQAPSLFLEDVGYFREMSAIRANAIAVAYLDVDDFKSLNTKHGHEVVDRDVLPIFMRELERFAFGRGYAYRFGGDEYAVLLINAQGSAEAFQELQRGLARLTYQGVPERTSVSIGLIIAGADCFLTDQGVRDRANRAMLYAKNRGKNCIATFSGDSYRDEQPHILGAGGKAAEAQTT